MLDDVCAGGPLVLTSFLAIVKAHGDGILSHNYRKRQTSPHCTCPTRPTLPSHRLAGRVPRARGQLISDARNHRNPYDDIHDDRD